MPNGPSVYQRYFWYLRLLTYNGFVVLVDNHLNSDPTIINAGVDTWFSVRTRRSPLSLHRIGLTAEPHFWLVSSSLHTPQLLGAPIPAVSA